MRDNRPPPPITISDPSRPGVPADLLGVGADKDPWRPSRRQSQIALSTLLAVALVASVTLIVEHRRGERAKDRAAVAAIALAANLRTNDETFGRSFGGSVGGGTLAVDLRNDGPAEVRLLSYRVGLPGFTEQRVAQDLAQFHSVTIQVPDEATCNASLLDVSTVTMQVRLVTSRGDQVTRTLPVEPDFTISFAQEPRLRCGLLRPDEAFGLQSAVTAQRHGDVLQATLNLTNDGILPLNLDALHLDGLDITSTPRLPLALPARRNNTVIGAGLDVQFRVNDCASVDQALLPGNPGETVAELTADLTSRGSSTSTNLTLTDDAGNDPLTAFVRDLCGGP